MTDDKPDSDNGAGSQLPPHSIEPHPASTPRWSLDGPNPMTGTRRTDHGRNHDPRRPGDLGNPIFLPE